MGFKNLRNFNLTLLAKQGWRLMQDEDSLLYKLLKSRYFSRFNVIDASLGHCPSYTRRGI